MQQGRGREREQERTQGQWGGKEEEEEEEAAGGERVSPAPHGQGIAPHPPFIPPCPHASLSSGYL